MRYIIAIFLFVIFLIACDDHTSTIDDDLVAVDPFRNKECVKIYKETNEKAKKTGVCDNSLEEYEHFDLEKCRLLYKEAKERCLVFLREDYKN